MTSSIRPCGRWFFVLVQVAAGYVIAERLASAEIILDTYDLPVEIRTDYLGGYREVLQSDFSDLVYERATAVQWWDETRVSFTVNVDEASQAVMHLEEAPVAPSIALTNAFAFSYYLRQYTDLTEAGQNDAFLIDFARYGGPTPPRTLRMIVFSSTPPSRLAYAYMFDIPPSDEPFTLAVPFDAFANRVGGGVPDFTRMNLVGLEVHGSGIWHSYPEEGFTVAIDTLRVGRMVPETATGAWCLFMVALLRRWRCRISEFGKLAPYATTPGSIGIQVNVAA